MKYYCSYFDLIWPFYSLCSYILEELRPGNTTPISCFKLLIAIAHTNDKIASTLIDEQRLFRSLIELFLPMVMNIGNISDFVKYLIEF